MKMKKVFSLLVGAGLVVSLAACGSSGSESTSGGKDVGEKAEKDVKKITMWSNDQHDQEIIEEKIQEFNDTIGKEKGIEVEYTVYGSDYYSTLDVAVSAGEGPDIYKCNKIGNYAEAGYIMPWDEEEGFAPLIDQFGEYNAPGYGEFDDKTYSVPVRVTTYGVACNKDIFEKNNLELPETWDEMEEAAKVITENGNGQTYGYALAMGYGSYQYFYLNAPNAASVGDEYFNHTTGTYDFQSVGGFFDHLNTFIEDGSMFPGYETMDGDTARAQFSAGNIGMIGVMSSDVTTFKNQFPCEFDWEMIYYPVEDTSNRYKEPVSVSMSYVVNSKAQKEGYAGEVAEFMNYLYSDEVALATSDAELDISILGNEITSQSEKTDRDKNWEKFSDMDVYCIKLPTPDDKLAIEGETYQDVYDKILTGAITDVDAALKDLDERYNAALDAAVESGDLVREDYMDPETQNKMTWTK